MSSNVTLRGLLGLGDAPAGLQDSALVMIDCQNTYRRGVMQLHGAEDAIENMREGSRVPAGKCAKIGIHGKGKGQGNDPLPLLVTPACRIP